MTYSEAAAESPRLDGTGTIGLGELVVLPPLRLGRGFARRAVARALALAVHGLVVVVAVQRGLQDSEGSAKQRRRKHSAVYRPSTGPELT